MQEGVTPLWDLVLGAIYSFRQRFSTWPTRALIGQPMLARIETEAGAHAIEALRKRMHLVIPPDVEKVLVYDDLHRFCDLTDAETKELEEVKHWLTSDLP